MRAAIWERIAGRLEAGARLRAERRELERARDLRRAWVDAMVQAGRLLRAGPAESECVAWYGRFGDAERRAKAAGGVVSLGTERGYLVWRRRCSEAQ
ncbi:MAG: hypothetical protein GC160_02845 [Acidobacteria bacterium]|nr:hypothetical protein [Acidobacteriota bacterium]